MKVGVVGASGFVGRALLARLAAGGHVAVPFVRAPRGLSGERVSGDLDARTDWRGLLDDLDAIVHAAARVHIMRESAADALGAFRAINRDGTAALARAAAAAGVRRFVFLSTVKVNGEATVPGRPFRASDDPAPSAPYAVSKLEAEQALLETAAGATMEVAIIRPPLVYGPGARGNFRSMLRWVRKGVPLPLGAADGNRRSLVSVDNLVDLVVACLDHPAAAGAIFLVSDGEDLSTAGLLRRLGAAAGRPARLLSVPPALLRLGARLLGRSTEADRLLGDLQVDIGETCDRLGWRPPVPVDEGLRRAVAAPEAA